MELSKFSLIALSIIAFILLGLAMFIDWPFPIGTILLIVAVTIGITASYLIYRFNLRRAMKY